MFENKYDEVYLYTTSNTDLDEAISAAIRSIKEYERVDVPIDAPRVAIPDLSRQEMIDRLEEDLWEPGYIYYGRNLHADDTETKHVNVEFSVSVDDLPLFDHDSPAMRKFVLDHPVVAEATSGWNVDGMGVRIFHNSFVRSVHRSEAETEKRYFIVGSTIDGSRGFKTSEEAEAEVIKRLDKEETFTHRSVRERSYSIVAVDMPVDGTFKTTITSKAIAAKIDFSAHLIRAKTSNPRICGYVVGIPFKYNGSFGAAN